MAKDNRMESFYTLTGMSLLDAVRKLGEVLPPEAYQAVPGNAADLTDINPAYLTQVATQVFGLCGVGWTFDYDPANIVVTKEVRQKRDGGDRTVYVATLSALKLSYAVDNGDQVMWSQPILGTGGAENDNIGYAIRGALTNAIGAAFAKLCWQLLVYQGRLDHRNAKTMYNNQQARRGGTTTEKTAPEVVETQPATQEPEPEPLPQEPEPAPVEAAPTVLHGADWAKAQVIPEGLAFAGKSLGDAMADQTLGQYVIKWLTGKYANAGGDLFVPKDQAGKNLQEAATMLYGLLPKGKAKK